MKSVSLKLAALLLFCAAPVIALAQDMPAGAWAGTWVANSAKSKFPGPAPTLDQVTIQPDGAVAVHVVSADGKTADWSYKPQAGKSVPIQGRDNTTVEVVKVGERTVFHRLFGSKSRWWSLASLCVITGIFLLIRYNGRRRKDAARGGAS